ncbi:hypothetical protein MD484_g1541, partial [Candolleomyces efflorescens]
MSSTTNFQSGDLQPQRQAGVFEFGMFSTPPHRGASLTPVSGQDERAASQNPALLDTSSSSDPWFFAPQSQPSHQRQSPQRPPPSTASMIGPTSTFFDAEVSSHQSTDAYAQQYRDWADSFGSQRQPVQSQSHQAHRPTVAQNQPQGQYAFSGARYVSGDAASQYSHSTAGTVTQENMGTSNFPENSAGFNAQGLDVYAHFYDQVLAAEARGPSAPSRPNVVSSSQQLYASRPSPDSTLHSYTSTPDPAFHRPQPSHPPQQEAYPPPGQLHPSAHTRAQQQASHVPRPRAQATQPPGAMSFPVQFAQPQQYRNPDSTHSTSQSGSSHSPKSWTEDTLSAQPSPRVAQFTQRATSSAEGTVTASSKLSGSPPAKQAPPSGGSANPQNVATTSKTERKRKRARKDEEGQVQWSVPGGPQASDSESDDELGGGYRVGMGGLGIASRAGRSERASARL